MNKLNKVKLLAVTGLAAVTIGGFAFTATPSAFAATTTTSTSLVDKIATTFNLDKTKVEAVFKQDRLDHETERLNSLVSSGKITEAQKTEFLKLKTALDDKMESLRDKNLSRTDMETQTKTERDALQKWVTDNKLEGVLGRGPGMHMGRPMDGTIPTAQ